MTNANDDIYPIVYQASNYQDGSYEPATHFSGLTKREYFTAMAMQGLLASYAGLQQSPNKQAIAFNSVEFTDIIINELNKTNSK